MSDQSGDELEASTHAPGGSGTAPARAAPAAGPPPAARLHSRVVRLGRPLDLLDVAGETGFVWRSDAVELVGKGEAARIPLGTGRERLGQAADQVAEVLGGARVDDPEGSGLGPVAVAAVPFDDRAPGQLTVPALLLRRGTDGATWAVATSAHRAPLPPDPDALARVAGRDGPWPRVKAVRAPQGQQRADWEAAVTRVARCATVGRRTTSAGVTSTSSATLARISATASTTTPCSAAVLSEVCSQASRSAAAAGVPPLATVPAIGCEVASPPRRATSSSGLAPRKAPLAYR